MSRIFNKQVLAWIIFLGLLAIFCVGGYKFKKSMSRADYIFSQAYSDFEQGDYQNSYYLFKKVNVLSDLKPIALFHQGECAQKLGDDKSAIKQYQLVFNNYPNHELSAVSTYRVAQLLYDEQPRLAGKLYKKIIEDYPKTQYATASEYYLGSLLLRKYDDGKSIFPKSAKSDVEATFRHYLTQAPTGRFALNACQKWLDLDVEHYDEDLLLIAKTYYLFGDTAKAQKVLNRVNISQNWTLGVKNAYSAKDFSQVKFLTKTGLKNHANTVDEKELIEALDLYLLGEKYRSNAVNDLLKYEFENGRDYLLSQKCSASKVEQKEACYNDLYLKYPNGDFTADALANIFMEKLRKKDYENAIKIGNNHLSKYSNVNSSAMVAFWMGKIYEKYNDYSKYTKAYEDVILNYPDSYYAYRAYIKLNRVENSLIAGVYTSKGVEFPYEYKRNSVVAKLVSCRDYEILSEYYQDDEFVKSWILYEKGDISHSALVARDAMDKLAEKPDKYDLRWRLVYPLNYEDDIKKYSDMAKNNTLLMMALVREESYFNQNAESFVGALGLMQLMPETAKEIGRAYGINVKSKDKMLDEDTNLKAGNYYYASLKRELGGNNISAIASYNGGIGSFKQWKKTLDYSDIDSFIEQIPYSETQNYVKKIYRSYWNYLRLYQ